MARVKPGRNLKGTAPLTGAVSFRIDRSRTYAQKWPRKRGLPKQTYQRAGLERLRIAQNAVKHMPGDDVTPMREGLQTFMDRHRGVRGTAAIRLRDWLTQVVYGRAWSLQLPDGTVVYSAQVQRDCSDFLDWLEPRIGSLVTRTDEAWLPTVNCKRGRLLTLTGPGEQGRACPPASIPPARLAMGGHG